MQQKMVTVTQVVVCYLNRLVWFSASALGRQQSGPGLAVTCSSCSASSAELLNDLRWPFPVPRKDLAHFFDQDFSFQFVVASSELVGTRALQKPSSMCPNRILGILPTSMDLDIPWHVPWIFPGTSFPGMKRIEVEGFLFPNVA